jgi:hypothetical protein
VYCVSSDIHNSVNEPVSTGCNLVGTGLVTLGARLLYHLNQSSRYGNDYGTPLLANRHVVATFPVKPGEEHLPAIPAVHFIRSLGITLTSYAFQGQVTREVDSHEYRTTRSRKMCVENVVSRCREGSHRLRTWIQRIGVSTLADVALSVAKMRVQSWRCPVSHRQDSRRSS